MSTLTYFFAGVNFKELPDKTGGNSTKMMGKLKFFTFNELQASEMPYYAKHHASGLATKEQERVAW